MCYNQYKSQAENNLKPIIQLVKMAIHQTGIVRVSNFQP